MPKVMVWGDIFITKSPCIIEVHVDPNQQYHHRVKSKLVDGKMVTALMNEVD
jgi:hypothetical protein